MAQSAHVGPSHISYIDGLLCGSAWAGPITFAIAAHAPTDGGYAPQAVEVPDASTAAAVRDVLAAVDGFTNARFVEADERQASVRVFVADALAIPTGHGIARLPLGGYAFFPGDTAEAGDVWLGTEHEGEFTPGTYAYRTLMHEIGHALGLKHGHDTGAFGPLPERLDGAEMSVMSVRTLPGDAVGRGLTVEPGGFSETFMPYDIAALQHLYGADYSDGADSRYRFDPGLRTMSRTIWDGGGRDTYDFSRYPLGVRVDLAPGGVCTTGQEAQMNGALPDRTPIYADGAIHNAFLFDGNWRSGIENAVGGWGDDTIAGNRLANRLVGNFGDDTVAGLAGADSLVGADGGDRLVGGAGADRLDGGGDADKLLGGAADDALFGGGGDDALTGGAGADRLSGASGVDVLRGGAGDDTLAGGLGRDVFLLEGGDDTASDFRVGADRIDVADPAAAFASLRDGAGGALVTAGDASLYLAGVAAAALDPGDFI